ncbi:MAG: SCO family protein [Erythrobacter sp.]
MPEGAAALAHGAQASLSSAGLCLWLMVASGAGLAAALLVPQSGAGMAPVAFSAEIGGAFMLTAPDGTAVSDETLKGAPFVLLFGFTRCPEPCTARLARLLEARRAAGASAKDLPIVFVSVDPAYDSPERLERFTRQFAAPVLGLTGSAEAITAITRAYNAAYFTAPMCGGGYAINHSGAAYLMNRQGRLHAVINDDAAPAETLAKLRQLAAL